MAAIQRQLGEGDEGKAAEMAELGEAITKAQMPKEVDEQARKELPPIPEVERFLEFVSSSQRGVPA